MTALTPGQRALHGLPPVVDALAKVPRELLFEILAKRQAKAIRGAGGVFAAGHGSIGEAIPALTWETALAARVFPQLAGDSLSEFEDLLADRIQDAAAGAAKAEEDAAAGGGRRVTLEVGQRRLDRATAAFFERAGKAEGKFFASLIRAGTGLGKSRSARRFTVPMLEKMRARGNMRTIAFAVPRHNLAEETAAALRQVAPGRTVKVWRGREQPNPAVPGTTMCEDLPLVQAAQGAALDPETHACAVCRHKTSCAYQLQRHTRPDVWVTSHALLAYPKPKAMGELAAIVVDEDPLGAFITEPSFLAVDALDTPAAIEGDALGTARLRDLRRQVVALLRQAREGPVSRQVFLDAGLSAEAAAEGHALEWATRLMPPDRRTNRDERFAAMRALTANHDLARRASWWKALAAILTPGGPNHSGYASVEVRAGDAGRQRVLRLQRRRDLGAGWKVPTLLLDATAEPDLLRHIWPGLEMTADITLAAPHMRVRQVRDSAFSLSRLDASTAPNAAEAKRRRNRLTDLHAILHREVRAHPGQRVLIAAQLQIREALEALGGFPARVEFTHHGGASGLDRWHNIGLLIVVGRAQPRPAAMEGLAASLTGAAVESLRGWYPRVAVGREMTDGRLTEATAERHPDPVTDAFRRRACEHGIVQLIGRGRGARRGPVEDGRTPIALDVLLLTDVPIDLPVDELVDVGSLDPSPDDEMLAQGGVAYSEPADAARAYPATWASNDAHRKAQHRWRERWRTNPYKISKGNVRHLSQVEFQRMGRGNQPAEAWVDPERVADARQAIEAAQGPLVAFRVLRAAKPVPAPPAPSPQLPRRTIRAFRPTHVPLPAAPVYIGGTHGSRPLPILPPDWLPQRRPWAAVGASP